jgi:hypothetical protein
MANGKPVSMKKGSGTHGASADHLENGGVTVMTKRGSPHTALEDDSNSIVLLDSGRWQERAIATDKGRK